MSVLIAEKDLPADLTAEQATELAYATELATIAADLTRGLPVLIECEKDLAPYLFLSLRQRLKPAGIQCAYLDGRPRNDSEGGPHSGMVSVMMQQLRESVRGAVDKRVAVLPHLDLLSNSPGGITPELRELIPLLYENPQLLWLGFKDPSFPLPRVVENLFPRRYSLLGVPRPRLGQLVTQREARKFGREFNAWGLYKYVSGMNAVRLRKLLSSLDGEDYPSSPQRAYRQVRQVTVNGYLEIPDVDLDRDLGGYARVKHRLRSEILDVLAARDRLADEAEASRMESLIPRGMIFWGPPGTGKTLFAKAMATAIGAAVTIVSGPELKSRWVGESEQNLRQIFHRARQSAPSIIVFDELDSFASARGTYTGSGVEHSMVNQLLTEMDGFHKEELVFLVGTTNFVESLDPALLRPGRFEFHLHIPYPDPDDRRDILKIYDASMQLAFTSAALETAVRQTGGFVEGAAIGTRFSGDHLNALCRSLARTRLREGNTGATTPADIERALTEWQEPPSWSEDAEAAMATHEAGHAVCALFAPHASPVDRVSLTGNLGAAVGPIEQHDRAQRFQMTRARLLDDLCVLAGGREAERLLHHEVSLGSSDDLAWATRKARCLVEDFGMGGIHAGLQRPLMEAGNAEPSVELSEAVRQTLDQAVINLLKEAQARAETILTTQRELLHRVRDALLARRVIDANALAELAKQKQ